MKKTEADYKYPPDFERLYTEMEEDKRKKLTYLGYLQVMKSLNQLCKALKKSKEDPDGKEK